MFSPQAPSGKKSHGLILLVPGAIFSLIASAPSFSATVLRLTGSGPFSTPEPSLEASSMHLRTSACHWHSTSQSSIRVSAFFARSFATSMICSACSVACASRLRCASGCPGWTAAASIIICRGYLPSDVPTRSGISVGQMPHERSSVSISATLAAAASQYGAVMLGKIVLVVLFSTFGYTWCAGFVSRRAYISSRLASSMPS